MRIVIITKKNLVIGSCAFLMFLSCVFALMIYKGKIQLNHPSDDDYPIKGVDVSSYQGEINWDILSGEDIKFAFIKATEGSGFVDPYFTVNYENAVETKLKVGAYHFFSYDSDGKTQAENYISAVKKTDGMLPPVIDVEFYGDYVNEPKNKNEVYEQLDAMLDELEDYYGVKPVIYATERSYRMYIEGKYDDYDIWIRNIMTEPKLSDGRAWSFWQYTSAEKLNGYNGKEKCIDMNVFNGTYEEFLKYCS